VGNSNSKSVSLDIRYKEDSPSATENRKMAISSEIDPTVVTDDEYPAALDGYYSDTPVELNPVYPPLKQNFDTVVIITNLPKVRHEGFINLFDLYIRIINLIATFFFEIVGFRVENSEAYESCCETSNTNRSTR